MTLGGSLGSPRYRDGGSVAASGLTFPVRDTTVHVTVGGAAAVKTGDVLAMTLSSTGAWTTAAAANSEELGRVASVPPVHGVFCVAMEPGNVGSVIQVKVRGLVKIHVISNSSATALTEGQIYQVTLNRNATATIASNAGRVCPAIGCEDSGGVAISATANATVLKWTYFDGLQPFYGFQGNL